MPYTPSEGDYAACHRSQPALPRHLLDSVQRAGPAVSFEETTLVEPVSGAERCPLLTAAGALDVITRLGASSAGRHVPGTGTLPLLRHLDDLSTVGYRGWVGLEDKPSSTSDQRFAWLSHDAHSNH